MFHKSINVAKLSQRYFLHNPVDVIMMPVLTKHHQHIKHITELNRLFSEGVVENVANKKELNFDNFKDVFKKKKFSELVRAVFIFRLCSIEWLLTHSGKIIFQGEKLLGRNLWNQVLKLTLYGQFVAGDNRSQIERTVNTLRSAGIGSLLGVPMEEDADSVESDRSQWYEKNVEVILNSINLAYELDHNYPMVHIKGTALMPSKLIAKISKLIPKPSENEEIIKHIAECIRNGNKVQINGLDTGELEELQNGLEKLRKIGETAFEKKVMFMFDAELTYVNAGLNLFTLALMLNYNTQLPLIFFTYQSYLKNSSVNLAKDITFTNVHGVKFGAKIVRGAYMDQERNRAIRKGYPDPIHDTYEDTSLQYQSNVEAMLKQIKKKPKNYRIFIATHNEEGVKQSIAKLDELGIDRVGGGVFFGQIYGMGDHITYALGKAEVLVYKALPYGPVTETLLYLVRRMHENKSILEGARRERILIQQALKSRIFLSK